MLPSPGQSNATKCSLTLLERYPAFPAAPEKVGRYQYAGL